MRQKDEALNARRKAEILKAAAACFAETGLHTTSMKRLCAAIGMSPGSLYRYYPSKTALIDALAASETEGNEAILAHLDRREDVLSALLEAVPSILEVTCSRTYARLATEISAEAVRAPERVAAFVHAEKKLFEGLAASFKRGQNNGVITATMPPEILARTVLAIFNGMSKECAVVAHAKPSDYVAPVSRALTGLLHVP